MADSMAKVGGDGAAGESGKGGNVNVDSLVDSALSSMLAEEGAQEPAEGDKTAEASEVAEDGEQGLEEPAEDQEEASEQLGGTEDKPWTVKDMPADRYVSVKVDGKPVTVSMREMADGYIRQETFRERVREAGDAGKKAKDIADRAISWQKQQAESLAQAMSSPEELLEYFMGGDEGREAVLRQLATAYAKIVKADQADPNARTRRANEREQKRLQAERTAWEQQRQQSEQQRQQQAAVEQQRAALAPGYQQGLKEAGLLGKELTPEFKSTVNGLLGALGRPATAEDVRVAIVRAAKVLDVKPATAAKPAPARIAPKPVKQEPANTNGKRAPRPGSVDAIMAGLKTPRF